MENITDNITEQFGCEDPNCLDCARSTIAGETNRDSDSLNGILVIYLNVGQLSPLKVDAFVARMRDKFQDVFLKLQNGGWANMIIPVRDHSSRVEALRLK